MKRRTYLGTLAALAVAGCTGSPASSGNPDDGTTDQQTTTDQPTDGSPTENSTNTSADETADPPTGDFPYVLGNVETGDPPVEDVTIDVAVTQEFTSDDPARLEVAFTNDADEERSFQFGSLVPWDGIRGKNADGRGVLLLAPGDGVVPDEPDGDCWQATDGVALADVMREETLDAGETVTGEFAVLAAHDSSECHPPGEYRFEDENYLEGGWWFSVDVAENSE